MIKLRVPCFIITEGATLSSIIAKNWRKQTVMIWNASAILRK